VASWSASDKLKRDQDMSYASGESNAFASPKSNLHCNDARRSSNTPNAVVPAMGPGGEILQPGKRFSRITRYCRFRSKVIIVAFLLVTLAISVDLSGNTSTGYYHCAGAVLHPPCSRGCPQLVLLVKLYVATYLIGLTFIPVLFAVEESSQRSGKVSRDDPSAPD
jgi:hypothetical protein